MPECSDRLPILHASFLHYGYGAVHLYTFAAGALLHAWYSFFFVFTVNLARLMLRFSSLGMRIKKERKNRECT
jgi:hypothetical protein